MKKQKNLNELSFKTVGKIVFKLLGAFLLNCVVAGALCAVIKTHQYSEVINLLCNFGVALCVGVHVILFMRGPEYLVKKELEKSNKEEIKEEPIKEIEKEEIKQKEKVYTTEEKIEALKHEKELLLNEEKEKVKVKVKEA